MAKVKRLNWNTDKGTAELSCTYGDQPFFSCTLSDLFEDWDILTDVQKETVAYGIKQKLSDTLAVPSEAPLTESEKQDALNVAWDRISVEGEWNAKPKKLTPLEKAQRALAAYEKEVEDYKRKLMESGTPVEQVDSINMTIWEPKRIELAAKVAELS